MDIISLYGSVGGSPVEIASSAEPGTIIHTNAIDSDHIEVVDGLMVVNPNPNTATMWFQYSGPGVPTFADRRDIPATPEGKNIPVNLVPLVLEPGYTLSAWTEASQGNANLFLYGHVRRYPMPSAAAAGGCGGLNQTGSFILGDGTLDGGWDTYPWTAGSLANPVNVVQDPANNRFQINREGVWALSVVLNIGFVSSNSGRTTYLRLYNETKGAEIERAPLVAGRDQEGALGVLIPIFDLDPSVVDDWLRVEIGGGDTFTGVTAEGADLALVHAGD